MKKTIQKLCALALVAVMSCAFEVNATSFGDIAGHWAEGVIEKWSEKGIILGYEGKFRPNDSIIRGDMAVIMNRIMNYTEISENSFWDLPSDAYYTEAILKLNKAGIILGADGMVRPGDYITREEAFVIFNRIYGFEAVDTAVEYSDISDASDWALETIAALSNADVIRGSDGKVNPKAYITRAEVLQMLENISNAAQETPESEPTITPTPVPGQVDDEELEIIEPTKRPSGNGGNSGSGNAGSSDDDDDNENSGSESGNESNNGEDNESGNSGNGGSEENPGGIGNEGDAVLGENEEVGGIW